MMKELRFAFYAIKKNIQSSAELRTSFLTNIIGMMINNTSFIILWVFFVKSVGVINGWRAADVIGLLGFTTLSYGIVFSPAFGLIKLPDYVANGSFDRFMLSPKSVLMRVATSSFSVSAIGDSIFGMIALAIYGFLIQATVLQVLLMCLLAIIAAFVHLAALIAIYSASFLFSANADSVTRGFFELFLTPSLFPGGAFQGVMRFFFTFFIPALAVGALPVEIVRDLSLGKLLIVSAVATLWFLLSLKIFYWGVKKYKSSNFMTFGS